MKVIERHKLNSSKVVIGGWLSSCSPIIAELMAICGYDFITIDVEHAPVDIENTYQLLQAIKSGNQECKSIVRVSGNSYTEIKRYMDAGADGIICPLIKTATEAKNLVDAVKYYPLGKRGVGYARSNNYGLDVHHSIKNDNSRTFVVVQIEHIEAIENLEEIFSVEGIDAAIIGPYDLSSSMGLQGEMGNPKMEQAIKYNLEMCKKYGIKPGIHVVNQDPEEVKKRIEQGYEFIAYSVDIKMISDASLQGLKEIKS